MTATRETLRDAQQHGADSEAAAAASKAAAFRPDLQGLRAIAVGVVLLYHAGIPLFSGGFIGVDVFFVISGYLITTGLLRSSLREGRIHLADFYAKRVRRILPAATLVLLFVGVMTLTVLPMTRWQSIGQDLIGSALYVANWNFAAGTDYLNADRAASPLQHFWTLSVEEQFYLVWPVIMIIGLWSAKRQSQRRAEPVADPERIRRYFQWGVWLIILPSLAWSVYETAVNPSPAYFHTTARLWELGIGAAVAIYATRLARISDRFGYLLGALGMGAILTSAVWFSAQAPAFPGAAAMLPTLGAAAVIVGGMAGRASTGIGYWLSLGPMRWVGDLSYSLYLWHWPLIVLATFWLGGELNPWAGLVVVTISFLPAWLSYHFVETPFRNWRLLKTRISSALQLGAAMMLGSAMVGASLNAIPAQYAVSAQDVAGAEALVSDPNAGEPIQHASAFAPSFGEVADDLPALYADGCGESSPAAVAKPCIYGDPDGDTTVALVGDSHAAQWFPALEPIAKQQGWRLEIYTKSSCPFATVSVLDGHDQRNSGCDDWNDQVTEALTGERKPNHVIVSSYGYRTVNDESYADGLAQAWQTVLDAEIELTVLVDPPAAGIDVPECVATHLDSLNSCTLPQGQGNSGGADAQLEAATEVDVSTVDMSELVCPEDECSPIIGDVLTFRDQHHLTATYVTTLTEPLEAALREDSTLPLD
ncbi:acyltransferase family protein [Gulosibacter chungangensis]|uniref:Acyltransferase n=1 Tax=Gulosibacter chungangensis TaxID=979746 RepID=A0A7J5BD76_9MICO|nr:acyltransferase family protein [Gulosibacter chungangensis]KAB1644165.1 acyltransferase [Gulosibacter chungangensis]